MLKSESCIWSSICLPYRKGDFLRLVSLIGFFWIFFSFFQFFQLLWFKRQRTMWNGCGLNCGDRGTNGAGRAASCSQEAGPGRFASRIVRQIHLTANCTATVSFLSPFPVCVQVRRVCELERPLASQVPAYFRVPFKPFIRSTKARFTTHKLIRDYANSVRGHSLFYSFFGREQICQRRLVMCVYEYGAVKILYVLYVVWNSMNSIQMNTNCLISCLHSSHSLVRMASLVHNLVEYQRYLRFVSLSRRLFIGV